AGGGAEGRVGEGVPQRDRAVAIGGGQLAVGAERHVEHADLGASDAEGGAKGLAGDGVPQPHRAIGACGGQQPAVGTERPRGHAVVARAGQKRRTLAGDRGPYPDWAPPVGGLPPATLGGCPPRPAPTWVCSGVPSGWRVTGFHARAVAFSSSLASILPLGLNASPNTLTPPVWRPFGRGVPTGCRLTGFHSRTMPLVSALASSLPLGLNATTDTPPEGPDPVWRGAPTAWPGARFPSPTLPPGPALASSLPSGVDRTA